MLFPAKIENLEPMQAYIEEEAKKQGFDNKKLNQLRLCCEEVLVNIINYAYQDKSGDIEIACRPKENNSLEIEIADWGFEFDPLKMQEPDINAPIEERKIGGLGVFLVRKLMDKVSYKREGGRNVLTITKN